MRRQSVLICVVVVISTPVAGFANLSNGLVAHYAFDGNADDSTGVNHGTVYGATWTAGSIGQALQFDGEDDYVSVPNHASQQISGNQLTLSAWIRMSGDVEDGLQTRIVSKQQDNGLAWGLEIFGAGRHGATGNQFNFHDSDGYSWRNVMSPTHLQVGQLYHVAVTDNAGVVTLYIDGKEDVSYGGGLGIPSLIDAPIMIGAAHPGAAFFDGLIDEVRMYDRVLSPAEIGELAVVPLPGAVLLGAVGLAFSGWRLRRSPLASKIGNKAL